MVISRRRDESIVIDGEVTVTVLEIGDEWVQLWIEQRVGNARGAILETGDWTDVGPGVQVTLVRTREDKARLGIEAPMHYSVHRGEMYEAIHGSAAATGASFTFGEVEPMYERFTDRARKIMQLANEEAQRFDHEYIGTEHILLGLVKEGSGVAANVLKNLDVDIRKIRQEVEKLVQTGPKMVIAGKLPHTPRAKKVIEYALEEARGLGHNYVGTEHLLLGLLREPEGVGRQVLVNLGLIVDEVRQEVLNLLGHGMEATDPVTQIPSRWRQGLDLSDGAVELLEQAAREAQQRDEGVISTAHLLLGMLSRESSPGAVLQQLGISSEAVMTEMDKLLLESSPWLHVPNTPLASRLTAALKAAVNEAWARSGKKELKDRLEQLKREKEQAVTAQEFERAARLRDEGDAIKKKIGEEHPRVEPPDLLLALLRTPDSVAARIIQNLGLHPEQVRTEVLRRLGEHGA